MPGQTNARAFESCVEALRPTHGGWKSGAVAGWDKELALFPTEMFAFLQDTQG